MEVSIWQKNKNQSFLLTKNISNMTHSWEGTHNEDYLQVFKYMDPYIFAYTGIGLVLGLSVLGAAWG